ncbi:hypothetical protein PSFL111601_09590 [Pseudomonas floridensis]
MPIYRGPCNPLGSRKFAFRYLPSLSKADSENAAWKTSALTYTGFVG